MKKIFYITISIVIIVLINIFLTLYISNNEFSDFIVLVIVFLGFLINLIMFLFGLVKYIVKNCEYVLSDDLENIGAYAKYIIIFICIEIFLGIEYLFMTQFGK